MPEPERADASLPFAVLSPTHVSTSSMHVSPDDLKAAIRQLAAGIGYVRCGVTSAAPFDEFAQSIRSRALQFPESAQLYAPLANRCDPRRGKPWACSIIVCIRWYGRYYTHGELPSGIGRNYLFDRRHKGCPDSGMPRRMKQGLRELGLRVSAGGVPERWAAVRAGVGRFGRNCFVYAGEYGSWINIESFIVDAELPPDDPTPELACPETCGACLRSCPTAAIVAPLSMNYARCVAYLTYAAPHPVDPALWDRMEEWVYGCDRCQLVCPLNATAWKRLEHAAWIEPVIRLLAPESLSRMDDQTFRSQIHPLFWYIPETDVARWRRNAQRAQSCSSA